MDETGTGDAQQKGILERFLGLFADVRKGETATLLLLMVNIFLVLTSYYILKPVRDGLMLVEGGAEVKSYSSAGQSLLLLGFIPAYSWLASRVSRQRLLNCVYAFFIVSLVGFFLLDKAGARIGIAFYLWLGIFNVSIIAQFWSFANDLYTEAQGKRLFALVGFGQSIGAVLGSWLTGRLLEAPAERAMPAWLAGFGEQLERPLKLLPQLQVAQLLPIACAILILALVITNVVFARERQQRMRPGAASDRKPTEAAAAEEKVGTGGAWRAFELVRKHRYLLLIALLILFLNWVNTTGEYILDRIVTDAAVAEAGELTGEAEEQFLKTYNSKFKADFFFVVNLVSLSIQLFLVSRILKYAGVRVALLLLPLIALGGYSLIVFYPLLSIIRWAKTAENATDYSLQNTLRGVLYLPTTREEKYMAKQAIDTFFVRFGDVMSAVLVFVGTTWLKFTTASFAMVNLGFVAVWLVLAVLIGREYMRLAANRPVPAPPAE